MCRELSESARYRDPLQASPWRFDQRCGEFYGRFPYPPQASVYSRPEDPAFGVLFLNYDVGSWNGTRIPPSPSIWVPGCGTDQAIHIGLRFPTGNIIGSDVSARSLEIAAKTASQLGVTNVQFIHESLAEAGYIERFDYVVCTGVIHHHPDPAALLALSARALKQHGVLELMVYNSYHRRPATLLQQAIGLLADAPNQLDGAGDAARLAVARELVRSFRLDNSTGRMFKTLIGASPSVLADTLLQPYEVTFTLADLRDTIQAAGLQLIAPRHNAVDRSKNADWLLTFESSTLQAQYERLNDLDRLTVAQILLGERSPMLWFYLERQTATPRGDMEVIMNETLGDSLIVRYGTYEVVSIRSHKTGLVSPRLRRPLPAIQPAPEVRPFHDLVGDGAKAMDKVRSRAGYIKDKATMSRLRTKLVTSVAPYLRVALRR